MPSQNPHPRTLIGWEAIAPKLLSIVNQEQNLHRMSNRWSESTSEKIACAKQAIDSSSHAARSFFEYLEFCRPTRPLQISLITSYLAFSISVSLCFYFVNSTAQKMISVFTTALSLSLSLSVGFLSMNTLAPPSHSPSSRVIANPMTLSSTLLFCFFSKKTLLDVHIVLQAQLDVCPPAQAFRPEKNELQLFFFFLLFLFASSALSPLSPLSLFTSPQCLLSRLTSVWVWAPDNCQETTKLDLRSFCFGWKKKKRGFICLEVSIFDSRFPVKLSKV